MCNFIPCFVSLFHDDGPFTIPVLGSRDGSKFGVIPNLITTNNVIPWTWLGYPTTSDLAFGIFRSYAVVGTM